MRGSKLAAQIVYEQKQSELWRKKSGRMKKERFEIGDELIFTGQEYVLAKVFNYSEKFKDKKLIVKSIQRCPCEENRNDQIQFEGIERFLSFYIF